MNVVVMGAAGFIGTNLSIGLLKEGVEKLILVDEKSEYFISNPIINDDKVSIILKSFSRHTDFTDVVNKNDIVFHLISTTNPSSSNRHISDEITDNIAITVNLLEACVKKEVQRIIFVSSGGTIYGEAECPIREDADENPINTYGIQKITLEKLLYLYHYLYGLDYRIGRLSNPYGPYQRPNGRLGAISTFTYRALTNKTIEVYGDGTAVRDYIYIDDAISALLKIGFSDCIYKIYNIGSGVGISINEIIEKIRHLLGVELNVRYISERKVDLKKNYLNISRYQDEFGKICNVDINEGIVRTADSLREKIK